MKYLSAGKSVIAPSFAFQRTRNFVPWPDNGDLYYVSKSFVTPEISNLLVWWILKDGTMRIYSYGPWPDAITSALLDAVYYDIPYAGFVGGEAYNYLIRGSLNSVT